MPAHFRERSLTALVIVESILLFIIAPLTATTHTPFLLVASMIAVNVIAVLAVVWHIRSAVAAVIGAAAIEIAAVALRTVQPSARSQSISTWRPHLRSPIA